MGKTRSIIVKVTEKEFARYSDLAKQLDDNLSEMGRSAYLAMMPVWEQRARSLNPA